MAFVVSILVLCLLGVSHAVPTRGQNMFSGRCPRGSFYADDTDKNIYYQCVPGDPDSGVADSEVLMRCAEMTIWNQELLTCVHQEAPQIVLAPTHPPVAGCTPGFRADPHDCRHFLICDGQTETRLDCPEGLKFDDTHKVCNWATAVNC